VDFFNALSEAVPGMKGARWLQMENKRSCWASSCSLLSGKQKDRPLGAARA